MKIFLPTGRLLLGIIASGLLAGHSVAQSPTPSVNTAIIPAIKGSETKPAAGASPAPAVSPGGGAEGAASPAPPKENTWLRDHESFLALAKKGDIELLFMGDSITNRWKSAGKTVWAERYKPLKAANFGIGGDRTEHVLWRIQNGELEGFKPKAVVLMIGTNNSGKNTAAEISEAITLIVKEIRERLPESKILLVGIFPRGTPGNDRQVKIDEINKTIAQLADDKNIFYIDFGDKLRQPDGTISKEMMTDGVHINTPGYVIWADAMQPRIDAIFKP